MKILVTGAGGGSGLSTIRILKNTTEHTVIGADCNCFSSGLKLADYEVVLPKADSPHYLDAVIKIIDKYEIDIIIPNVDDELEIFAANKAKLHQVLISPPKTIKVCNDKLQTIKTLSKVVNTPITYNEDNLDNIVFPVVLRPRISRGSRNIFIIKNRHQLDLLRGYFDSMGIFREKRILQEYLPGEEYTIDCLFDMQGKIIVAVPRRRITTQGGVCSIGRTEHNNVLIKSVQKISDVLDFEGPVNIQFRSDPHGVLKLLEINPRIAGAVPITLCAGVNIPDLSIKMFFGDNITEEETLFKEKSVFRYLTEI